MGIGFIGLGQVSGDSIITYVDNLYVINGGGARTNSQVWAKNTYQNKNTWKNTKMNWGSFSVKETDAQKQGSCYGGTVLCQTVKVQKYLKLSISPHIQDGYRIHISV